MLKKSDIKVCLDTLTGRLQLEEENGMNVGLEYGSRALFNAEIHTNKKLTNDIFTAKNMTPKKIKNIANKYLTSKNLYVSIVGNHPKNFIKKLLK